MPKYKVVATGPIMLEKSIFSARLWLKTTKSRDRLISVAGVHVPLIPLINISDAAGTALGRFVNVFGEDVVAVRSELTIDDFEIEIVSG